MRTPIIGTALVLCAAASLASAQSLIGGASVGEPVPALNAAPQGKLLDFKLGGSVGAAGVTNFDTHRTEIMNAVSLQPELAVGKLGLGLDLYVYFDSDGKARKQDWDNPGDIVTKIWYVRWGKKGEPVYARLGGLNGATLGHGLIMNRYNNRLAYPDVHKVGAELDVDAEYAGAQGVIGDVQRATLLGGRVFARPMRGTSVPLLKDMTVGASGVTDRDPDDYKGTHGDQVSVYGVDAAVPVLAAESMTAQVYGDAAMMRLGDRYTAAGSKDNGKGFAAGVAGRIAMAVDYKGELRVLDDNFVAGFFDSFYELDRSTGGVNKADRIPGTSRPQRRGPLAELSADILGKLRVGASFEDLNYDPLNEYPRVRGEARLDPSLFLGKVELSSCYERRNVNTFRDLGRTRGTSSIITSEIGVLPAEHLRIAMIFRTSFAEDGRMVRTTQVRADARF